MTTLPDDVTFRMGRTDVRSGDVEQLVTTTETPGGFGRCTFSICGQLRPELTDIVRIYNSTYDKYPFIGRVSDVHKKGLTYDVIATRSSRDRTYGKNTVPISPSHPGGETSERIYEAGTQLYVILTDALSITPDIFDGGIVNPGLQLVADSQDVGGFTAEQVWDYVSSILGSLATPLLWHIRGSGGLQVVVIDYQDTAARYYVELAESQIEETYTVNAIVNEAAVAYGKGQIAVSPSSGSISHSVLQNIRTKYVNASNSGVTRITEAQELADSYVTRYNDLQSNNDTLTIKCGQDQLRVVPPVHTVPIDDWPLMLVESGHGILLKNRPSTLYPYNKALKYITGTSYNWDSGELTCNCGSVQTIESTTQRIIDYNVNRLFNGPYNGPAALNHPLADADLTPKVGPEIDGASPPATSYGTPAFKEALSPEDPNVKYGKQIDPDLVADEGLEANINFDPSISGFQAAVRVIPGTFSEYRLLLGNSSGLVDDTVDAEIYRVIPPSENPLGGTQFLCSISSTGLKDRTAVIAPNAVLKRGDYAMIKVTTSGITATWAAVSLHAKKNFPRLKS